MAGHEGGADAGGSSPFELAMLEYPSQPYLLTWGIGITDPWIGTGIQIPSHF